ncbi:hypothetical protein GCM10008938_23530 [Deinococcus roseus]|uniref:Beta-lactamase-related domain-containing protein n=1 Tax=Deinococcus roseus TaxID=392414 RepID=A0ABQ2CZP6_9DEIO|nr:hypothetical protein GCM10008938_23530 [Deinococcus roseus]
MFEGSLLSKESKKALSTPQVLAYHDQPYSYGLTVGQDEGKPLIQHGGSVSGFQSSMMYFPEQKLSVVVLGNVGYFPADELALNLAHAALGEAVTLPAVRPSLTLTPEQFKKTEGTTSLREQNSASSSSRKTETSPCCPPEAPPLPAGRKP